MLNSQVSKVANIRDNKVLENNSEYTVFHVNPSNLLGRMDMEVCPKHQNFAFSGDQDHYGHVYVAEG